MENVYEKALIMELLNRGLHIENQVPIEVLYKGCDLGLQYRVDFKEGLRRTVDFFKQVGDEQDFRD